MTKMHVFLMLFASFTYAALYVLSERKSLDARFLCDPTSQVGSGYWSPSSDRFYAIPCCSGQFAGECKYPSSRLKMKIGAKLFRTFRGMQDTYSRYFGHTCKCKVPLQMEWIPHMCKLLDFDGKLFCKLLRNRTVLFIGDSTMEQSAAALINVIHFDKGGCETSITHALSDTLVMSPKTFAPQDRGLYWLDWVDIYKPSVVIMNVGAHIAPGVHNASVLQYTEIMHQVKKDYSNRSNEFELIWKTMNPGGCSEKPNVDIDWGMYEGRYGEQYARYTEFDKIAISILGPSVPVLDVSPLSKRGDAHPSSNGAAFQSAIDCLHFCSPGPLTFVARILQQHFFMSQS